ncbi:hypothetical protein J2W70_001374 [Pseudomonas koreensis]|nr:hypothetical protein [Pseudomonas koreensis]
MLLFIGPNHGTPRSDKGRDSLMETNNRAPIITPSF